MLKKPVKKLFCNFFFGVEGCVVDHPRITIIKEEEKKNKTLFSRKTHPF
jgi:hypothetical protein